MAEKKVCCIFGAGEYFGTEKVVENSYVIAADGGFRYLEKTGIIADAVIGDFDSLDDVPQHKNIIRLNPIKDDTDIVSAVKYALEIGSNEFHFFGGTGGRTAHTLANLQILVMLAKQGISGYLYGNGEIFTAVHNDKINFTASSHGYISVFSMGEKCVGVSEKGLKYTLKNYTITNDFPIGVSNEFIGVESEISVENGTLLIVYTNKATKI